MKASRFKQGVQSGEKEGVKPNGHREPRGYIISVLPSPLSVNIGPKRLRLRRIARE